MVWKEYTEQKGLALECPVTVVAFGKLGGQELNYSSDIDLVYVLQDGLDEKVERHAFRFCEMFSRALSDNMGRGSLYRVDLRLRPFGGAGPVAPSMRAVEAYYRSHAELWEAQALIRSRPLCGLPEIWPRWQTLIEAHCFKKSISDFTLGVLLDTRDRIEEHADVDDLKRGPGGIRDVEFLVQIMQMLHGYVHVEVRVPSTLEALKALTQVGIVDKDSASALSEGYTFLRQMEHRCQLVDDQQTHAIPASRTGREHLARLMGYAGWLTLEGELGFQRRRIRDIYAAVLKGGTPESSQRDDVLGRLSPSIRVGVASWFDKLPECAEFYRSLKENGGSLERAVAIAAYAPTLLSKLADDLGVTEAVLSGEIEEPAVLNLPAYRPGRPEEFAAAAQTIWLHRVAAWTLDSSQDLGPILTELYDALVSNIAKSAGATFDVIALGSYGLTDPGVDSDLDLLLLVGDDVPQDQAEVQAEIFLAAMNGLKRYGWRNDVDLRLRPEGGQGLPFRSHQGLRTYELERMEMWERFALGQARPVYGNPYSCALAQRVAYAMPLTPENLQELVTMKRRIETERVQPQYFKRDVKLGYGGLSDIEWLVHLFEMRYPTALETGKHVTEGDRIRRMAQAQLINAVERDQLVYARTHHLRVRNFLSLLGFTPDVLPENPDKLERIAGAMGLKSGYEFQKLHATIIESVRAIYLEGLERLGV